MAVTEIDWVERWRLIVEAKLDQTRRFQPKPAERSPSHWDELASSFSRMAERADVDDQGVLSFIRERVSPDKSLLDVGAGAGRYAAHLAPNVRELIAVEPSAGMRRALQEQIDRRQLKNVSVIASTWEAASVAPADIVLSANVIYWTVDIVPFLRKLQQHARERCLIVLRATQSLEAFAPLWLELRGEPPTPQPSFMDLFNLLFQLGARPDAHLIQIAHHRWSSVDEAVDRVARDLMLPASAPERARVREYVEATISSQDGYWTDPVPAWIGIADIPSTPAMSPG